MVIITKDGVEVKRVTHCTEDAAKVGSTPANSIESTDECKHENLPFVCETCQEIYCGDCGFSSAGCDCEDKTTPQQDDEVQNDA